MAIRIVVKVFAIVSLLIPTATYTAEAQRYTNWVYDSSGEAYTSSSSGTMMFYCSYGELRVTLTMSGYASSSYEQVMLWFDDAGYRYGFDAENAAGVVILKGPFESTAKALLSLGRQYRLLDARGAGGRGLFSLMGLTAATKKLSCVE